jgi:hypothetical protein
MASKGASALTGAGTGAAVGTAIMPGIGTAVGAGLGAVGGYLLGDDEPAAPAYTPDAANFQYGLGAGIDANGNLMGRTQAEYDAAAQAERDAKAAKLAADLAALDPSSPTYEADKLALKAQAWSTRSTGPAGGPVVADTFAAQRTRELAGQQQGLAALGQDAYARAAPTQAMPGHITQAFSGGQSYLQGADAEARAAQLQALGGVQSQTQRFNDFADREQGPSAAQAQLQTGIDMAAKQQFGMARAQPGGGGAALRNAAFNAAGITGNAANSAAVLRAQEDAAFRAQQLQALGGAQQGAANAAGVAGQLRGADQSFAATQAGQANTDAAATNAFNQAQQNVEFQVGANNLTAAGQARGQNDLMTLGTVQGIQNLNNQIETVSQNKLNSGIAYEGAKAQGAGLTTQNNAVNNAQSNAETGMALGAISSGVGYYADSQKPQGGGGNNAGTMKSDVRAKKDIVPVSMSRRDFPDAPAEFAGMPSPDEHTRAQQLQALGGMGGFTAPNLRPAQGYEYSYKDPKSPGAGPGRFVGPMAQDLENLPGVVEKGPDGQKAINAPRLSLATASAVSEQQRRLDEIQAQIAALSGSRGTSYPVPRQPDYAAYGGR